MENERESNGNEIRAKIMGIVISIKREKSIRFRQRGVHHPVVL